VDLAAAQGEALVADRLVHRATGQSLLPGGLPGVDPVAVLPAVVADVEWARGVLASCAWLLGIVSDPPLRLPATPPARAAELYRKATEGGEGAGTSARGISRRYGLRRTPRRRSTGSSSTTPPRTRRRASSLRRLARDDPQGRRRHLCAQLVVRGPVELDLTTVGEVYARPLRCGSFHPTAPRSAVRPKVPGLAGGLERPLTQRRPPHFAIGAPSSSALHRLHTHARRRRPQLGHGPHSGMTSGRPAPGHLPCGTPMRAADGGPDGAACSQPTPRRRCRASVTRPARKSCSTRPSFLSKRIQATGQRPHHKYAAIPSPAYRDGSARSCFGTFECPHLRERTCRERPALAGSCRPQ
jgi:hypothetical protein